MNLKRDELVVRIDGVVIPRLVAVALLGLAISGSLCLILAVSAWRESAREIRVLQLHIQDLESAMIRTGAATRRDFAQWPRKEGE